MAEYFPSIEIQNTINRLGSLYKRVKMVLDNGYSVNINSDGVLIPVSSKIKKSRNGRHIITNKDINNHLAIRKDLKLEQDRLDVAIEYMGNPI